MNHVSVAVDATLRVQRAWAVLDDVLDPEVPAVSVRDLGIVRDVRVAGDALEIVLTPTYSGCPATEVIEQDVLAAIDAAGLGPAHVTLQRAPAWTTDWITERGRARLLAYGIAPPGPLPPGTLTSTSPTASSACVARVSPAISKRP